MPAVDLDAIRADLERACEVGAAGFRTNHALAAGHRFLDVHAPALLAYVAELHAAANKRCDENLATFHRQRALIERLGAEVEEIRATREDVSGRLIAALAELDRLRVRLDEANARTAAKGRALMAAGRTVEQLTAELEHAQATARDGSLRLSAIRLLAKELLRYFAGDGWELPAAIRNIADTRKPFLGSLPRSPVPVWVVVAEEHTTTDAQLRAVLETAGGEKAAESPADPPAPLSPGTPREAV